VYLINANKRHPVTAFELQLSETFRRSATLKSVFLYWFTVGTESHSPSAYVQFD